MSVTMTGAYHRGFGCWVGRFALRRGGQVGLSSRGLGHGGLPFPQRHDLALA